MKSKSIIILVYCMFVTATVFGQDNGPTSSYKKLALKASYFGEFALHPGFTGGIDYTIHKSQWFNLHWDSELGAYFHKWNNNAVFIQSTLGTRFTTSFSAFADVNVGLGYMVTTPNGDVYSVDENGDITSEGRPFYSHLKPTVSILFGWDGTRKRDIPLLIYAGFEAYWESHFNHSMLAHGALRIGVTYRLKNK